MATSLFVQNKILERTIDTEPKQEACVLFFPDRCRSGKGKTGSGKGIFSSEHLMQLDCYFMINRSRGGAKRALQTVDFLQGWMDPGGEKCKR